jgi:hypothetical protein
VVVGSLIAQELARSLVGLARGHRATVVLGVFGGRTTFTPRLPPGLSTVAVVVGPVFSLAVGLGLGAIGRSLPSAPWIRSAASFNLAWGLVTVLPMLPFDGGRLLAMWLGPRREVASMLVSVGVAEVAGCLAFVIIRSPELAALLLAAGVSTAWRWANAHRYRLEEWARAQLDDASRHLATESFSSAWDVAHGVANADCGAVLRNQALATMAWAALGLNRPLEAQNVLDHVRPGNFVDPYTLAAVQGATGYRDRAIATLDAAMQSGRVGRSAARLLVDLLVAAGDLPRAGRAAGTLAAILGPDDVRLVARALEGAGESELAASLMGVFGGLVAAARAEEPARVHGLNERPAPESSGMR